MLWLILGGALGTLLRYGVSRWVGSYSWGQVFPAGTLIVNVLGSFILGAAAYVILERLPPEYQGWYLLIGTGFCGGLTTFSTFELETYRLVRDGSHWYALTNIVGSVVAGFIALVFGIVSARMILMRLST